MRNLEGDGASREAEALRGAAAIVLNTEGRMLQHCSIHKPCVGTVPPH
jgi:hypothetical protein